VVNPADFRDLVSGDRRGIGAAGLRLLLQAAAGPYAAAVRLRNRAYDCRIRSVHKVAVPVVCVGNVTLGGTGKTPLVAWLADWFSRRAVRPVIVSRGYGASGGQSNDEARELALKLPEVVHLQDPDRVAAARRAIDEHGAEVVVLDDGFQHRRLARDLDIVLIDALEPFGFGHVFPRGMLREPVSGLARAGVVALSRADMASDQTRRAVRTEVDRYAGGAAWCELAHAAHRLVNAGGASSPIDHLHGRRLAAFCGIGNPAGFRHTLDQCGYQVVSTRTLADHHNYTRGDCLELARWAADANAEGVVCTVKDLVKINADRLGEIPLWAVSIDLDVVAGLEALEGALERLLDN
jgi:tetraacyldisaccharide 4'-kinase